MNDLQNRASLGTDNTKLSICRLVGWSRDRGKPGVQRVVVWLGAGVDAVGSR